MTYSVYLYIFNEYFPLVYVYIYGRRSFGFNGYF